MKNNLIKYYIAAIFLCSNIVMFAQPGTNDTGGTLENTDPPAPIDDYVLVLAIIGLAFVFLKVKNFTKQTN